MSARADLSRKAPSKMKRFILAAAFVALSGSAFAQNAQRVSNCGNGNPPNGSSPATQDTVGNLCTRTGAYGILTLDVKTVTTGGTAVTALNAGHRTAGGWLSNPKGATIDLCINEIGTASGTVSNGDTTCIAPGQSYTLTPAAGAVSVVTSDSAHPFSGQGFN